MTFGRDTPAYRAITALLAGLAAGLAHPPFGLLLGLLGYSIILLRLETLPAPRALPEAFRLGWLAGIGYFGVSTWWIAEPFLVDARLYGWMAPFAVLLMGGGLALFWGFAALVYALLSPKGVGKTPVFAGVFAGAEWLRGHLLTGFPWNLPGESWHAGGAMSQSAAWAGAYGLTWITLALAATPALLMLPLSRRSRVGAILVGAVIMIGLYAGGAGRLAASQHPHVAGDAPMIRIVQANIDQKRKWKPENLQLIFDTYVALSTGPAAITPNVIIWPEGALPAVIDDLLVPESPYATRLRDAIKPTQTLLMGANRAEADAAGRARYFNTLVALRREGSALRVAGIYDKYRLVPFGEFLPFGELARRIGLRSLVHMEEDFTPGPRPRPLQVSGLPSFQPLICYEALFPGLSVSVPKDRPAWILNISNDAWFGATSGPLQHLNIASYRAIEQGLPIIRATPTGVSAVIDAQGRVVPGKRLGLGAFGTIDARLPPATPPTLYVRLGDWAFVGLLMISLGAWLAGRMRPGRTRP